MRSPRPIRSRGVETILHSNDSFTARRTLRIQLEQRPVYWNSQGEAGMPGPEIIELEQQVYELAAKLHESR